MKIEDVKADAEQIKADIEKRIDDFIERYAYDNKKTIEQLNVECLTLNIAHVGTIMLLREGEEIFGSCLVMDMPTGETMVVITGYYGEGSDQIH